MPTVLPTVLVVEDDDDIRESLAAILERHGYATLAARHGEEALQLLERVPAPDLIVIDLYMPVMDGKTLLEALRRLEAHAHTPVLIMSATSRMALPDDVPVVYKPFGVGIFLAAVRQHLRSPR